ncbi:MAG TPA: efflux RND transporter periplasmic adaptor subunit, partial [Geobacterales bacterium]|nr:efflux RND transporter periplasmic adaptor subunit [Geobacterales bacterium]
MNKTRMLIALLLLLAIAGGGWFLLRHLRHAGEESVAGTVLYTCPMHPFIIRDRPGSCPICGMELVKKVAAAGAGEAEMAHLAHVSLSPTQMVMANVATSEVRPQPLNREITAVGIVTYDQSRQAKVTAWVAGRLDRLHVSRVGDSVVKGGAVADIYAPDLVAAQQEYLLARRSREQLKGATIGAIQSGSEGLLAAARQRLKLLGVSDAQIANLEASGNVETRLAILSPISGVVLEKLVQEGEYVPEGGVLFNVADLSVVWVEAQVYETDLAAVHVGQTVTIMAQAYPGETFSGRVAMIYPFLDPKSRTV